MALILRRLATAERRGDYADRAIIEFTAAVYHFEQAGHERYCATTLNNLAMLLYQLKRYAESHEHLDQAAQILNRLSDDGLLAQVNETRARVLLAEGNYQEASATVVGVIKTFERGGEHALLSDALTIRGVALARLGQHEQSVNILRRSVRIAEESGASSNAAHAALSLIEEHADRLSPYDLYRICCVADDLLRDTQDAEDLSRLRKCARTVGLKLSGGELGGPTFSLKKAVLSYEANFIERALEQARGSVTRAAKLLGIGYSLPPTASRLRPAGRGWVRTGTSRAAATASPAHPDHHVLGEPRRAGGVARGRERFPNEAAGRGQVDHDGHTSFKQKINRERRQLNF